MIKITVRYLKQSTGATGQAPAPATEQETEHGKRTSESATLKYSQSSGGGKHSDNLHLSSKRKMSSATPESANSSIVKIKYRHTVNNDSGSSRPGVMQAKAQAASSKYCAAAPSSAGKPSQMMMAAGRSSCARQVPMPRGSLSSFSSSSPELSGTEEYYCSYREEEDDGDSSVFGDSPVPARRSAGPDTMVARVHNDQPQHSNISIQSDTMKLSTSIKTDGKPDAKRAPAAAVAVSSSSNSNSNNCSASKSIRNLRAQNKNKLHMRSISLIVNPNFGAERETPTKQHQQQQQQQEPQRKQELSSEDDDDEAIARERIFSARTKRRNSMMGYRHKSTRCESDRRQVGASDAAGQAARGERPVCDPKPASGQPSLRVELEHTRAEPQREEASELPREQLGEEAEDRRARLREIGFILRQISEEFARNRRLTV